MLNLDEIEISENWDVMKEHCTITAEAKVTGQYELSLEQINAAGFDIVRSAKVQCALRVFDVFYGDLREDTMQMIEMLERSHPDQVSVAEIKHRVVGKLGVPRG